MTDDPHDLLRRLTTAAGRGDIAAQVLLASALFHTDLRPEDGPSEELIRTAVAEALSRGVPPTPDEPLGARMAWCRNVVALTYAGAPQSRPDDDGHLRELFWRRAQ